MDSIDFLALTKAFNSCYLELAHELIKHNLVLEVLEDGNEIFDLVCPNLNGIYAIVPDCEAYTNFMYVLKNCFIDDDKLLRVLDEKHCIIWIPINEDYPY